MGVGVEECYQVHGERKQEKEEWKDVHGEQRADRGWMGAAEESR